MDRRQAVALLAASALIPLSRLTAALPAVQDRSFRDECSQGVDDLPSHCLKCHNPECMDARGPERLSHRLDIFLELVPEGMEPLFIKVGPRTFERLRAELGRKGELSFRLWPDRETRVVNRIWHSEEEVALHCYPGSWPLHPTGHGCKIVMEWATLSGYRLDIEWDEGDARVSDPVALDARA